MKQKLLNFILVCFQILLNFADDIKVEYKMVKRGILLSLMKCLSNTSNVSLLIVTVKFLWKLSTFTENRLAMVFFYNFLYNAEFFQDSFGLIEKCMLFFRINSVELSSLLFALFFNLSFEPSFRKQMVNAGLINVLASYIESLFL